MALCARLYVAKKKRREKGRSMTVYPDRASTLWGLVGRLERGDRLTAEAEEDILAARQLAGVLEVLEVLDEIGEIFQVEAHGECSCNDGHCPGFGPPRSLTTDELEEIAYEVLVILEGRAAKKQAREARREYWAVK
jgi:hypothetical protein